MKSTAIVPLVKKIEKNKFRNNEKLSAVFDRVMLNVYENNIFPTLSCVVVGIHENSSQHSNDEFCFKIRILQKIFRKPLLIVYNSTDLVKIHLI